MNVRWLSDQVVQGSGLVRTFIGKRCRANNHEPIISLSGANEKFCYHKLEIYDALDETGSMRAG
jgi:hypothetical protein